jgi:hypothetical protein
MTPSGIEPATFRFVAHCLNHCATISGPQFDSEEFNYVFVSKGLIYMLVYCLYHKLLACTDLLYEKQEKTKHAIEAKHNSFVLKGICF